MSLPSHVSHKKAFSVGFTYRGLTKILVALLLLFSGCGIGYFYAMYTYPAGFAIKRADNSEFSFINPLLSCGLSENKEFDEYKPLEATIKSYLDKNNPDNKLTVSVYYRDLNSGRWFGLNEEETYSPASLFKVPILIAYLKQSEGNPSILEKVIHFSGESTVTNSTEYFKSSHFIKPGTSYTVDELLSYMIKYSDNDAMSLLFQMMNTNSLSEVVSDIGLHIPSDNAHTGDDFVTVKDYSYLFRLLYNATYLNKNLSEKALKLMSESDFQEGLSQGIPATITLSHKFGERVTLDPDTFQPQQHELHDCGIIYYPNHPYLMCVMTKGEDLNSLSSVIGGTSKLVYHYVEKEYK